MRITRSIIFAILIGLTAWFVVLAATTPPDPHYGRIGAIAFYGLLSFLIWIPYNIACMFADKNTTLGLTTVAVVVIVLGNLALAIVFKHWGMHVIALLLCPVGLIAIWTLSIINYWKKRDAARVTRRESV